MFENGDIVIWHEDSNFWVIIDKNSPRESDPNVYFWRMRRKNDQKRMPKCMVSCSNQLTFVCRPLIVFNQELIYRRFIVKVIKDMGTRVQCVTVRILERSSPSLFNCRNFIGRKMEILKSALVESNISTFT